MDRSLDDFTGSEEDERSDDPTTEVADATVTTETATVDTDTTDTDTTDAHTPSDTDDGTGPSLTVRPAESTMAWTPGGADCEACANTVERRWRDDGRLVCLDCKSW